VERRAVRVPSVPFRPLPIHARIEATFDSGRSRLFWIACIPAVLQNSDMRIDALWQDIRFSCRSLIRRPAFALVAIFTFALGIGANTAIFSVVNAVLIQPLPYRDPSRLTFVWGDMSAIGYPRGPISGPEFTDLRQHATLFSSFGAIWANSATISGDGDPQQLRVGFVTSNFFDTLGATAAIGRTFNEAEEEESAPPSILLSWAVFQQRYGGDPSIVGKNIQVNGQATTVIGIMPADFRLLFPPDAAVYEDLEAWVPWLPFSNLASGLRRQNFLRVVGRMKPGVELDQAREEVSQIAGRISREYSNYGATGRRFNLVGLHSEGVRDVRPGLIAVLGGVVILLLTACLNVASLLIARASARTKETALRLAVGASHPQIVRQCLVEGLILALTGGVVGVFVGELGLRALVALRPAALTRIGDASIDSTVLIFTGCVALFWGVLFSFAPMTQVIMRTDVIGSVLANTRHIGAGRYRMRAALVTLQVALGVVLLVGAGLMIRTFASIQRLDPGYKPDRMLTFRLSLPDRYDSQIAVNAFHQRLQAELAALPGVTGTGAVSHLPFDNIPNWGSPYLTTPGQDPTSAPFADFRSVSPGYLETMGARLVEGRFFTEADAPGSQPVVIVDDLVAKRSWPGESAVGKRISIDPSVSGLPERRAWATVVGVVRHMRIRSLVEELSDQVYMPIRMVPRPTTYVVQAAGDPAELAGLTRDAIRRLEPQAPVYDIHLLDENLMGARSVQRFTMLLAGAFAGVALALAFVGVYGLITYSVNTRRYEFGVRLALGARSDQIVRLAMREGMVLLIAGLGVGLAGALGVAYFLRSQLFGVTPLDLPTYIIAIAVIAIAGFFACWLPARRASVSNPLEVMRAQ
jgi:predicted permease